MLPSCSIRRRPVVLGRIQKKVIICDLDARKSTQQHLFTRWLQAQLDLISEDASIVMTSRYDHCGTVPRQLLERSTGRHRDQKIQAP